MKNFKILLLFISLIIYSNCADDDCAKLTPEATCTANTSCQWNAAKCSGDTGSVCSAKSNTNQTACEAETFTGTLKCEYVAEIASCTNTSGSPDLSTCSALTSNAACTGNSGCNWTVTTNATCTGHASCADVATPSEANCAAKTYSGSANCEWSDAVCGTKPAETPSSTTPADSFSGYIKFSYFAGLFFFLF